LARPQDDLPLEQVIRANGVGALVCAAEERVDAPGRAEEELRRDDHAVVQRVEERELSREVADDRLEELFREEIRPTGFAAFHRPVVDVDELLQPPSLEIELYADAGSARLLDVLPDLVLDVHPERVRLGAEIAHDVLEPLLRHPRVRKELLREQSQPDEL